MAGDSALVATSLLVIVPSAISTDLTLPLTISTDCTPAALMISTDHIVPSAISPVVTA